ncbi:MAG: hypothetical protein AB2A00_13995 [Myxococcota bacterium]
MSYASPPTSPADSHSRRAASVRRLAGALCLLLASCEGCDLDDLLGWLPFDIPGLTQDAGPGAVNPLTPGAFDAAGFFDDAGVARAGEGESCLELGCVTGTDCVTVSSRERRCLRPCSGGCASTQQCESLVPGSYCLTVVGRGERCETRSCILDGGLRCQPARAEANAVLAYTCQLPCSLGSDVDSGVCPTGESCLPSSTGEMELQGGAAVACEPAACAAGADGGLDGGACPCTEPYACVTTSGGGVCARAAGVCGTPSAPSDPALLDEPSRWPAESTCDPGSTQRYCVPDRDAGAPVYCFQGAGGEVAGLCVAICVDPSTGETHNCPGGFDCVDDAQALFHVRSPDAGCDEPSDCDRDAGEQCVGPLPAFDMGRRCGVPYGLCQPRP